MEETVFKAMINGQLSAMHRASVEAFGDTSEITRSLKAALDATSEDATNDENQVIPEGFASRAEVDEFLMEQADAFTIDAETPEEAQEIRAGVYENVKDIAGVIVDENNPDNDRVVGDVETSAHEMNEAIRALEEEAGEEIEVGNVLTVTYSLRGNDELTNEDVQDILDSRISEPLKHFGELAFYGIENGDTPSEKRAVFQVLEAGAVSLKQLALNATAYRGTHVFPGIGAVTAVGSVSWE